MASYDMSGKASSSSSRSHFLLLFVIVLLAIAVTVLSIVVVIESRNNDGDDSKELSREAPDSAESTHSPVSTESPDTEHLFAKATMGQFRFAGVADDAGICSKIGTDVLSRRGGSVVDAAIATMLCVGVVNAHSCGVGGGHFMTIYQAPRGEGEKEIMTVLARERAPAAATDNMYVNASSTRGGLAVGIPGEIRGYYEEWQRYGRLPWSDLFQPTIDLCVNGYAVNHAMAVAISRIENTIRASPGLSEILVKSDGRLIQEGDIMHRPKLAITLQKIAADPMAFYNPSSDLAQDIVADIQEHGGIITLEDLKGYAPYVKEAINSTLQNGAYTVFSPPPPSGGAVLQHIFNILDGYYMSPSDFETTEDKILTYHRIVEAFKFAYGKRSALGDAEFVDVQGILDNMTSSEFSESIRRLIDDSTTQDLEFYQPAFEVAADGGTVHLSILAPDGSAVSITSSINLFFGSKIRGSRTGIFFNNEMDDFSTPGTVNSYGLPASPSNFIVPGKMPMSSMSPSIILDSEGNVRFITGASGGSIIISATAFVTMHALWLGKDLDVATGLHRLHHQLLPNFICVESGFDEEVAEGLRNKGHVINTCRSAVVQSIYNTCNSRDITQPEYDCIKAVSDGRKSGVPDGF